MAQSHSHIPLLAPLMEDERAQAMVRSRIIAPLLDPAGPTLATGQATAAGHGSRKTLPW